MICVWPWVCALLSGVMVAVSFPPLAWGGLVWVALMPLAAAVWFSRPAARLEWLRLAGLGFLCGLGYFALASWWLTSLTVPGWALATIYSALYPAVWSLFFGTALRPSAEAVWLGSWHNLRVCALGAAGWVSSEWLRGVVFPRFGWDGLGVALHGNIPLIQIADITGVGGITFLVVMANLMGVATVRRLMLETGRGARRPHYDFAVTVAMVALAWAYGIRQMLAPAPESLDLTFAAVQANISQATRNDVAREMDVLDLYVKHTGAAAAMRPDLIIWPESSTPRPLFNDQRTWDIVRGLAESAEGDLLLGTVHFSAEGDYNSMVLLTGRGRGAQMYHKIHLVPFGEYVPLRESFPLFAWVVGDLVPGDFDAGPPPRVLRMAAKPVNLAPLICFEDTVGDLARQFAGAQVFVVGTNDAWFLESCGSRQHLINAVFRCAENKLPMIRAANTGVTCLVDRFGAVREVLRSDGGNLFVEGVLFGKTPVPVKPVPTFYADHGEFFSLLCLVMTGGVAILFGVRKIKKSSCPPSSKTEISRS